MRAAIYISGIAGLVFFAIACIGYLIDFNNYQYYFILSLGLFLLATLPLSILQRLQYNRRKKTILKTYKKKKGTKNDSSTDHQNLTRYPAFRNKKRGLTWGGGNIHGSTAKRGSKTGFLKH